jgi:hypothetical protein
MTFAEMPAHLQAEFPAVIVDCPHYLSKRSKRKAKEDTD